MMSVARSQIRQEERAKAILNRKNLFAHDDYPVKLFVYLPMSDVRLSSEKASFAIQDAICSRELPNIQF